MGEYIFIGNSVYYSLPGIKIKSETALKCFFFQLCDFKISSSRLLDILNEASSENLCGGHANQRLTVLLVTFVGQLWSIDRVFTYVNQSLRLNTHVMLHLFQEPLLGHGGATRESASGAAGCERPRQHWCYSRQGNGSLDVDPH